MVDAKTSLAVLVFLMATPAFGEKIKPEEYTYSARVVEVTRQDEARFRKNDSQAAATSDDTTTKSATHYILKTEINDKEYDLQGTLLLELGNYPAKIMEATASTPAQVVFLLQNKKGRSITAQFQILGVRMKPAEKAD